VNKEMYIGIHSRFWDVVRSSCP